MKKILVILTGGTIGSKSENGTVNVNSTSAYKIIDLYCDKYGSDVEFDAVQPVNVLSENITDEIWLKLFDCLDSVDCSKYSGIIVCHGSDTLSYTASMVGMLYNKLDIPLVFIAANYELGNEKSNGITNFRSAVILIKSMVKGVFVAYSNNKGDNDIYIATRIVEADAYIDQYRSFDGMSWGRIEDNRLTVIMKPDINELNNFKSVITKRPDNFNNKVIFLRPYPNMNYDNICLDNVSAVIHYMYHSATGCTEGESTSVIKFAKRCNEKGVKLYMASFKDKDIKRAYKSSRDILENKVIPMFNISPEAAYVKVLIAENLADFDINKTVYFECM